MSAFRNGIALCVVTSLLSSNFAFAAEALTTELPSQSINQSKNLNEAKISASRARMRTYQVNVLKELADLGYVDFVEVKVTDNETRIVVKALDKYLELQKQITKLEEKADSAALVSSAGSGTAGMGLAFAMILSLNGDFIPEGGGAALGLGVSFWSIVSAAAANLYAINAGKNKPELRDQQQAAKEKALVEIQKDAKFNTLLSRLITNTENWFDLHSNDMYVLSRAYLINAYKADVASDLLALAIAENEKTLQFKVDQLAFANYLAREGMISEEELGNVSAILRLIQQTKISVPAAEASAFQMQQAEILLAITKTVAVETESVTKKAELEKIAKKISNEIEVIRLLQK